MTRTTRHTHSSVCAVLRCLRQIVISQLIFAIRLASGMAFYTAAQRRWHSTKTILRKLPFHYRPFKLPTYAVHFDMLTIDVVWTIIPVEVVHICYKLSLPTFWAVRFRAIDRSIDRLWRRTAKSVSSAVALLIFAGQALRDRHALGDLAQCRLPGKLVLRNALMAR